MTNKELEREINILREQLAAVARKVDLSIDTNLTRKITKTMNECEWEEIIEICDNDEKSLYFERDDYKEIELKSGEIVKAKIIGTHHDIMENGEYASATLQFTIDGEYEMNEECTNEGGWEESKMKTVYMERIYNLLPDELKKYIVPVIKTTSAGNKSEELIRKPNKLFLLSEKEYSNTTEYSVDGEGEQYEYFKNGGELPKKWQWLRSPYPTGTYGFGGVFHYGFATGGTASNPDGVCPCFAISNRNITHD